jgi:crotonobetainyl-CoA:carnitine CoA-transferase CaiB-like acyl-CoA transferase
MIDLAIFEPIMLVMGPQPVYHDQLGLVPRRIGNRSELNAPRDTYRSRDGRWLAISASANTIAERVLRLVGHPEVLAEPWFATGAGRAAHGDLLNGMVADWIAQRDADDVVSEFEAAGAAVAPIYDVSQVIADPQVRALETFLTMQDDDLGPIRMQNVPFRMSKTPGRPRFTGRRLGQDNDEFYRKLGRDPDVLRAHGVI